MTATDQLAAIEARDVKTRLCADPCPSRECQTEHDRRALLAMVRERDAALERVEALADSCDGLGSHASYHGTEAEMETWLSAANLIRAAITATEGAGRPRYNDWAAVEEFEEGA